MLDAQSQNTDYQFEHVNGVVGRINRTEGDAIDLSNLVLSQASDGGTNNDDNSTDPGPRLEWSPQPAVDQQTVFDLCDNN